MISIIVPVYNVEPYLEKCLNSILAQTYNDIEVLIIDDGSTDHCGEICDHYAAQDNRIRVFHTENRGLSAARNIGLDHARGQYIGFVDSDDWIEPDMYNRLFCIMQDTDADIVTCRFFQEYCNKTEESSGPLSMFMVKGNDILRTYLLQHNICQDSWNNLFKADLFQSIRYPEGRSFEDYSIKLPLLQKALMMVYTPDCLLHYRNRQNSLSKVHTLKSNVDYWQVYRERFDYLSPISEEYYRLSLTQAMGAIGRMWRWIGACSKEERRQAQVWLDEMQQFNNMHFKEIMKDPAYPRYTKFVCLCAKSKGSILFRVLYTGNQIYRRHRSDNEEYYS